MTKLDNFLKNYSKIGQISENTNKIDDFFSKLSKFFENKTKRNFLFYNRYHKIG